MGDFEQGFSEELEKLGRAVAQPVPEETFATEQPAATVLGGHFLYPPLQWAPGMEIKGRIAERGGLSEAPWVVKHPILFPALAGLGAGALGAGLGGALGGDDAAARALQGALAGGGLGVTGGALYGAHKGKEYLKELREQQGVKTAKARWVKELAPDIKTVMSGIEHGKVRVKGLSPLHTHFPAVRRGAAKDIVRKRVGDSPSGEVSRVDSGIPLKEMDPAKREAWKRIYERRAALRKFKQEQAAPPKKGLLSRLFGR